MEAELNGMDEPTTQVVLMELRALIQEEFLKQSEILLELTADMRMHLAFPPQTAVKESGATRPESQKAMRSQPFHLKPENYRPEEKVLQETSIELMSHEPLVTYSPAATTPVPETTERITSKSRQWDSVVNHFSEHHEKAQNAGYQARAGSSQSSQPLQSPSCVMRIVSAPLFHHGIMAIILVNLVLLGIEVDVAASLAYGETPVYFNEINMLVVGIFMMEVLLKLIALGVRGYFCAKEKWWNIFDFAIVSLSVVELILEFLVMTISGNMDSSHLRILRFARFARTLRGVRVVRLLRYIGSLRTIVFSIISTMGSLFWTLVLLLMIFYCFSVIITQSVTDFCRLSAELGEPHNCQELTMYWATVPESMLTLFLAISGGLSWKEALNPLRRVGVIAFASVILYVVITIFAILNVVTGVFCNTAIESAGADKEIAIMKQMKKQDAQMETLREIFTEIDIDCSNQISLAELKEALKAPKLRSFMSSLQISTEDAWTLFMTVDADGSGEISLDEFVAGCMQLQGPAKGLQVARMSYENMVMRAEIRKMREDLVHMHPLGLEHEKTSRSSRHSREGRSIEAL